MQPAFKALLASSLISVLVASVTGAPPACLTSGTFEQLVDCLDDYTVPENFYINEAAYNAAQPTVAQASAWSNAVTNLMSVGVGAYTCNRATTTITNSSALWNIYNFATYSDSVTKKDYCVLIESTSTTGGAYTKGWGFLAVPIAHNVTNGVHISAPHPAFDQNTPQQAGALFKRVGARSLLIAGRSRLAYRVATTCVIPSSSNVTYYKTDPAHDNEQPFFAAGVALYNAQIAQAGCPAATCGFVQFHGKGNTTCTSDNMFLSAGIGKFSGSLSICPCLHLTLFQSVRQQFEFGHLVHRRYSPPSEDSKDKTPFC